MTDLTSTFQTIRTRIDAAALAAHRLRGVRLLAVGKTKPVSAIRALAELGQLAFGENYVQEALFKQQELVDLSLEWHLIGPLQSNKCRETACHFDWLQTLDREKLIEPLARYRPAHLAPLNVLIQINIDAETSKSGCPPHLMPYLAEHISQAPSLKLRGLMAIPAPHPDPGQRRHSFKRMRQLFEKLQQTYPSVDTLSMGMSDDFELAIAEGATMVRMGSALFGTR